MKNFALRYLAFLVFGLGILTLPLAGQTLEVESQTSQLHLGLNPDGRVPGISLAEGVTQITGVAISPLWGMSALGAWKYYHTAPELRHKLPWYCHHYVWGFCFAILGVGLLKDVLGVTVPAIIKKPLDFVELFEDKLSAIVASGAFVPLVALAMAQYQQIPEATASTHLAPMGMASVLGLGNLSAVDLRSVILVPISMIGFFVVWLASHSINVLIALSPFSLVDAALKLIKGALLSLVATMSAIHPYLGLVVCIPIILIAIPISGWSFRLSTFGAALGLDLLRRKKAAANDYDEVRAFSARDLKVVPVRTRGRILRTQAGTMEFHYRPWLILPMRRIVIELPHSRLEEGLIYSEIHHGEMVGSVLQWRKYFITLPRYQAAPELIVEKLGLHERTDSLMKRGVKSVQQWLSELIHLARFKRGAAS